MNNKHWLVPDWPAPGNIHAATTLRTGGVSQDEFASLNPAAHVGDKPDKVSQNSRIIKTMLDLPSEPVWLNQTHSNRAVKAEITGTSPPADASYTDQPGVVCAVMTADCLPLAGLLGRWQGNRGYPCGLARIIGWHHRQYYYRLK